MERTVKDRLIEFIHYLGIGQNKFEKNCGISNGYISNIKANPSTKTLTKIFNAYPQLCRDWLVSGIGQMCNPSASDEAFEIMTQPQQDNSDQLAQLLVEKEHLIKQLQSLQQQLDEKDDVIRDLRQDKAFLRNMLEEKSGGAHYGKVAEK